MVVVVFGTKMRDDADLEEYARHSRRMNELVKQVPGFISIKGFVGEDGEEISIARFESDEAVKAWRSQLSPAHPAASPRSVLRVVLGPGVQHHSRLQLARA